MIDAEVNRRTPRLAKLLIHDLPAAWDAARGAVPLRPGASKQVHNERMAAFIASLPLGAADAYYGAVGVEHFKISGRTCWSPSARAAARALVGEP